MHTDHRGPTHGYYLDIPLQETLTRHATKHKADEYGERELRDWYRPLDLLRDGNETIIGADSPLEATVDHVMPNIGLARLPAHE
ncbi:hypothetical protein ACFRK5_38705 [Streptomyces niveus]|uniref:hypothetical protein n=1 Tax=Streptomyces niveus TaxID=193462 RepID=UPI0036A3286C